MNTAARGMVANQTMLVEKRPPLTATIQTTMPNMEAVTNWAARRTLPVPLSRKGPSSRPRLPTRMPLAIG